MKKLTQTEEEVLKERLLKEYLEKQKRQEQYKCHSKFLGAISSYQESIKDYKMSKRIDASLSVLTREITKHLEKNNG